MTNKPTELVVTQADINVPEEYKAFTTWAANWFPHERQAVTSTLFDAWLASARHRLASTAPASEDEVERVMSLVPQAYADIKLNLSDAVVCYGDAGGCVREDGCEDNCLMLATYCKGVEFGACAVIAALRPRSEREEIVRWLLDDGTRLDYEKQDEANREHPLWWAADMIERGDFKEPGE